MILFPFPKYFSVRIPHTLGVRRAQRHSKLRVIPWSPSNGTSNTARSVLSRAACTMKPASQLLIAMIIGPPLLDQSSCTHYRPSSLYMIIRGSDLPKGGIGATLSCEWDLTRYKIIQSWSSCWFLRVDWPIRKCNASLVAAYFSRGMLLQFAQ